MAGINLNKKLWRIPQQGMVRGVCAGIANYFDVPAKLVRILVVLSIFFGLALFTLVAYIILSFALDPMPDNMAFGEQLPSSSELLDEVDRELAASETRLREMERYVTSDTFTLRTVSVNCEESYEYSLATGRAKGKAWFQISRQAGTSYRTALWPGGCGGLGDKISCSPTAENVAGCGAGTAVKSGC